MSYLNKVVSGGKDISNLFGDFFSSVYTISDSSKAKVNIHVCNEVVDYGLKITIKEVFESISSLNNSVVAGPDGLCILFLKRCIYSLSTPLWTLFNKSLMVNQFPNIWKTSFVKPIFKSGNRNEVTNYRGV